MHIYSDEKKYIIFLSTLKYKHNTFKNLILNKNKLYEFELNFFF